MTSDESLSLLLIEAARMLRARNDRAFEEAGLGLTSGEARTLAYASLYPGSRQNALAARMSVEPMTLVGFLDRLEGRGLIVRDTDPTDRRAKIVSIAPTAQEAVERILTITRLVREAALSEFAPGEVEAFHGFLRRLRDRLAVQEPSGRVAQEAVAQ